METYSDFYYVFQERQCEVNCCGCVNEVAAGYVFDSQVLASTLRERSRFLNISLFVKHSSIVFAEKCEMLFAKRSPTCLLLMFSSRFRHCFVRRTIEKKFRRGQCKQYFWKLFLDLFAIIVSINTFSFSNYSVQSILFIPFSMFSLPLVW